MAPAVGSVGTIGAAATLAPAPSVFSLPKPLTNLFDPQRPGTPVVRPGDLLALRVELVNLRVTAGAPPKPPRLVYGVKDKPAYIVLHFPPQAIAEQVFFQTAGSGAKPPNVPPGAPPQNDVNDGSETPEPPPIRARVAGESRLAFKVPAGFNCAYTLAGVLGACEELAINVPANALPRATPSRSIGRAALSAADLMALPSSQRAALSSFVLRSSLVAARDGPSSPVLQARATLSDARLGWAVAVDRGLVFAIKPKPALPSSQQTAIEMPWRLILSPHANERWAHAHQPVTSPLTLRTELWHTRLIAPDAKGVSIEPPRPDPARTVRAVWALTGEGSDPAKPMKSDFPASTDIPLPNTSPFRATLSDFDRIQIAHLSSNFSISNYQPEPVDSNLLMLSALGGWLDARGAWEPPGLSVEEWVHRAAMGRDHYVRVVYKGFLFPFGHRVALIKVSERKFHNGRSGTTAMPGNPAYLRQRMFIIVRERERTYVDPSLVSNDAAARSFQRQFPFNSVRIITTVTPDLDTPTSAAAKIGAFDQTMFWPCVGAQPFNFRCVATDIDGRRVQFEIPLIFMDNTLASPRKPVGSGTNKKLVADFSAAEAAALSASNEWLANGARAGRRKVDFKRQRIALAPSLKAGDTAAEVEQMEFGCEISAKSQGLRTYSQNLSHPAFYPSVVAKRVRIAALAQLGGSDSTNRLTWNAYYLKNGFDAANKGQVFADVGNESGMAQLDFSTQGDRSGGFVMPNMKPSALSRLTGPVTGDTWDPLESTCRHASLSIL